MGEVFEIRLSQSPLDVGSPAQCAEPAAGGVNEDSVKAAGLKGRHASVGANQRDVRGSKALDVVFHELQTARVNVEGCDMGQAIAPFSDVGRLSSRSGAEVEYAFGRLGFQQVGAYHGRRILHHETALFEQPGPGRRGSAQHGEFFGDLGRLFDKAVCTH